VEHWILKVAVDTPLDLTFDYRWCGDAGCPAPMPGQLALVPLGRRETVGLIVGVSRTSTLAPEKLKDALALRHELAPLSEEWLALAAFAADYYQRPLGEVAIPALPRNLRAAKPTALLRALKKAGQEAAPHNPAAAAAPALNMLQQQAVDAIAAAQGFAPLLLYGVTGSGKTEVYLRAAADVLARAAQRGEQAQILILVPEINLTPQLEENVRLRFPSATVVSLHSGLAEGERTVNWVAAHLGHAHIVLGTRLAVMASLPNLKLIVIDEEHDTSYKQQEGLRYSARDLAVWRARQLAIPVVLGSATPSLESWQHAQSGRYQKLELRERAVKDAILPGVRLLDMERDKPVHGVTSQMLAALKLRLERGEQSLLFLNRRGYAPVISCDACGWVSACTRCTSFMVLHKGEQRLRCHHCSLELRVPKSCPTCGNVDLQPLGRGTQRIEESLQLIFPQARILRIDADSTRLKGSAHAAFSSVHQGEVDILVGTQMVAKGHDFKNLTLVGVLNPDTALFSHDYRAGERLFAQLMQVAGRAGRVARKEGGSAAEVLVQTRYPQHPLYGALAAHDYERFAAAMLEERRQAGLPPFMYQALLRAEDKELRRALDFLEGAATCLEHSGITINDPIPMSMARVANVERAQLLIESASRPALQAFLKDWLGLLRKMKARGRWSLEVDPVDI
jgi:primosomal protein N' (replication factor Y)